ncbi:hypothetical protein TNCV_2153171 [Trichonephila clavipes]|nr:hypothetical protein TNCV_2153171 [Trichonephila clavipes]
MWTPQTPQQKVQCVLWLTEFKSVTRVQPPDKSIKQTSNDIHFVRTSHSTRAADLNSANKSTHCIFYCRVHIFTKEVKVKVYRLRLPNNAPTCGRSN